MELTNTFTVDRPVAETWRILNDLEFIAPCMPGAKLTEVEGDEYRGLVKIKVGPITAQYKGKARFESQDEAAGVATLKAEGRDPRQGNAAALVTATLTEAGADATDVEIHTDLTISGKIAQFGRGAIEDVSKKLLGQFADNLQAKLDEEGAEAADPEADTSAAEAAPANEPAATESPAAEPVADAPAVEGGVRVIDSPDPEPVDLVSASGGAVVKRVAPVVGALLLLLILRRFLGGSDD